MHTSKGRGVDIEVVASNEAIATYLILPFLEEEKEITVTIRARGVTRSFFATLHKGSQRARLSDEGTAFLLTHLQEGEEVDLTAAKIKESIDGKPLKKLSF